MAYHTFAHVLDLDIEFHLGRRTGALSRILDRGMPLLLPLQLPGEVVANAAPHKELFRSWNAFGERCRAYL